MRRAPSPRPARRRHGGLLIFLHEDEWAPDVPLPEGSRLVHLGEHHEIPFYPQWHFWLQPDKTVEVLVGWYVVPFLFEDAISWYREEMVKAGWVEGPRVGYQMPGKALLRYHRPEESIRVEISLQWWEALEETTVMIRRVVEHPWEPVEVEELEALEQLQGEGEEEKWEEEEVVVGS